MAGEKMREASASMDKAIEAIRREFTTVRTGKATPMILETVRVEAYESLMPLNQLANVSAPEPQLLVVQPYDASISASIAAAIQSADLGLNPSVDGNIIRVPIPPLTEERRLEFVKVLHRMAEEGRVSVRHVRHVVKKDLETMQREGEIGEDDLHRRLHELQELTDKHIESIDNLLKKKEEEVMEV
jgi:ribosome recycling factor